MYVYLYVCMYECGYFVYQPAYDGVGNVICICQQPHRKQKNRINRKKLVEETSVYLCIYKPSCKFVYYVIQQHLFQDGTVDVSLFCNGIMQHGNLHGYTGFLLFSSFFLEKILIPRFLFIEVTYEILLICIYIRM